MLLGGVPGVPPAKVVILGGGVSGTSAAEIAVGMRADVTVVDRSLKRLRQLDAMFGGALKTAASTIEAIESLVTHADLVVGAVLVAGAAAPKLVTREMVRKMKAGAVMVDISIDQGGCFETSKPTTHAEPTFVVDGVVHYCVTNMPGAVPRTSTFALTNATLPYVRALADHGVGALGARSAPGERPERSPGRDHARSCRARPGPAVSRLQRAQRRGGLITEFPLFFLTPLPAPPRAFFCILARMFDRITPHQPDPHPRERRRLSVLQILLGAAYLVEGLKFALWPLQTGLFRPWQLLTYGFMHGSWTHLFFNMFGLYMFGSEVERAVRCRSAISSTT